METPKTRSGLPAAGFNPPQDFWNRAVVDEMGKPVPIADDAGGDVQFAGQIVDGNKLHAAILP